MRIYSRKLFILKFFQFLQSFFYGFYRFLIHIFISYITDANTKQHAYRIYNHMIKATVMMMYEKDRNYYYQSDQRPHKHSAALYSSELYTPCHSLTNR